MLIDELLWTGHALGRDIAGSKESVAAITREAMLEYLARQYQPHNTVLVVAGDIQHRDVVSTVNQATSGWGKHQPRIDITPYQEQKGRRVLIEKRDTEQANLCLALPGLSVTHPERFKIDLLNVVLGEGMSSRLFTEIRDKLGLAYSIMSYTEHYLDTGALTISAGVDSRNLTVAVKAIVAELSRLKELIPETELSKAKELYKGRIWLRMEDSRNVAGWLGGQEILTGEIMTVDEVIAVIEAITAQELRQLAEELLTGDKLRLAAVSPLVPDEPLEDVLKL